MSRRPGDNDEDDWLDLPSPQPLAPLDLPDDDLPDDDGLAAVPQPRTEALASLPEDHDPDGADDAPIPTLPQRDAGAAPFPEVWADDPALVPWQTHALVGDPPRRVPTTLDPTQARSVLRGPTAAAARLRIEIAALGFWVDVQAESGPTEALVLGRDALAGRIAVTCAEGDTP